MAEAATLQARVAALEAVFRHIAATRMAGVPLLHPGLSVAAVGFRTRGDGIACGVLVTPWFMNLVRLPLLSADHGALAVGHSAARDVGSQRFDFIGSFEPMLGACEMSSLFSPMFEFADQAAALATAQEVMRVLDTTPCAPAPAPARRGFLFGRSAVAGLAR